MEKFGAQSVLGRQLYAGEMNRINAAQNVYLARQSRDKSDNWAVWAEGNKQAAEILAYVETLNDG